MLIYYLLQGTRDVACFRLLFCTIMMKRILFVLLFYRYYVLGYTMSSLDSLHTPALGLNTSSAVTSLYTLGDYILVGAPDAEECGAVYILDTVTGVWRTLSAASGVWPGLNTVLRAGDGFGYHVTTYNTKSITSTYIVISAIYRDVGDMEAGSVYLLSLDDITAGLIVLDVSTLPQLLSIISEYAHFGTAVTEYDNDGDCKSLIISCPGCSHGNGADVIVDFQCDNVLLPTAVTVLDTGVKITSMITSVMSDMTVMAYISDTVYITTSAVPVTAVPVTSLRMCDDNAAVSLTIPNTVALAHTGHDDNVTLYILDHNAIHVLPISYNDDGLCYLQQPYTLDITAPDASSLLVTDNAYVGVDTAALHVYTLSEFAQIGLLSIQNTPTTLAGHVTTHIDNEQINIISVNDHVVMAQANWLYDEGYVDDRYQGPGGNMYNATDGYLGVSTVTSVPLSGSSITNLYDVDGNGVTDVGIISGINFIVMLMPQSSPVIVNHDVLNWLRMRLPACYIPNGPVVLSSAGDHVIFTLPDCDNCTAFAVTLTSSGALFRPSIIPIIGVVYCANVSDLDADGCDDIVCVHHDGHVAVALLMCNGTLQRTVQYNSDHLQLADILRPGSRVYSLGNSNVAYSTPADGSVSVLQFTSVGVQVLHFITPGVPQFGVSVSRISPDILLVATLDVLYVVYLDRPVAVCDNATCQEITSEICRADGMMLYDLHCVYCIDCPAGTWCSNYTCSACVDDTACPAGYYVNVTYCENHHDACAPCNAVVCPHGYYHDITQCTGTISGCTACNATSCRRTEYYVAEACSGVDPGCFECDSRIPACKSSMNYIKDSPKPHKDPEVELTDPEVIAASGSILVSIVLFALMLASWCRSKTKNEPQNRQHVVQSRPCQSSNSGDGDE